MNTKAVASKLGVAVLLLVANPIRSHAALPSLPEVVSNIVAHDDGLWRSFAKPADSISSRSLFAYALDLCEARQHPDRLDRLFELAAQMQDRDPQSRSFGNFHWYWSETRVQDYNAVDFCMRAGPLLWLKHRDFIPEPARKRLRELLEFGAQGCLRHKVNESYSNIALMNAGGLILLGETLEKPDVAEEGYARLDRVFHYTREAGVHEFDSPTYTGVDLDDLVTIEAFCKRDSGRAQARALLELFWTDIAVNWFPPAQKLAGAQSRTYDYLHGLGSLDVQLTLNGWLDAPLPHEIDAVFGAQAKWRPPQSLREMTGRFPRLVRQSWGREWWQSRTHYLPGDVTLSCIASSYGGRMDMPLTVDLPGDRKSVRCYFIADGRDDPYGQKKIPAGPHQKAFHLNPFWTAAQRNADALGLVVYRANDIPTNAATLVSDFVMPMEVDAFWVGGQRVAFTKGESSRVPVPSGESVVLRKGPAAVGLRVPWSRGLNGREAVAGLVYDGNEFGAVRLAVEHVAAGERPTAGANTAGAAFWVRIGNHLKTDAAFADWRLNFARVGADVKATPDRISLKVPGIDGPVALSAAAPWSVPESLEPAASRAVLEIDGADIGSKILGRTGP